ncbi:hypothetical protein GCM10010371_31810 [Streptomyces subrutilus]|uniref:Uncharacterized protein n=1 Tax=Streptomyces subrutilus TaxID=36818 RepID=A0A918QSG3_9ACTN|nr:hypothetical protein GCM10010371_31810 [Streptomyces subrutilus]
MRVPEQSHGVPLVPIPNDPRNRTDARPAAASPAGPTPPPLFPGSPVPTEEDPAPADGPRTGKTREALRISPEGLSPAVHSAGFEPATF